MAFQIPARVFLGLCIAASSHGIAQTASVTIQVLNDQNGRPLAHHGISVRIDPSEPHSIRNQPVTDGNGTLLVQVPLHTGLNATINEFPTCRHVPKKDRTKGPITFPVDKILAFGIVEANNCSHRTTPAIPGQLTLFVRPLHWWERLSD